MKDLRILDFFVHAGHQYELCKLGGQFDYITLSPERTEWPKNQRPQPSNVRFVKKFNIKDYDFMIVHLPRQLILASQYPDIPKVFIFHFSPMNERVRKNLQKKLKGYYLVFNSYESQEEWGFPAEFNQRVIWHGFDPDEWYVNKRTIPRVLTVCSKMIERPEVTGYELYKEVTKGLPCDLIGYNPTLHTKEAKSFEELKKYYRDYAVYFNPCLESPMPRSRGEAFMAGIPIVTTGRHDAKRFIKHFQNGFISDNPTKLKDYLKYIIKHQSFAQKIGRRARETAIKQFHIRRFLNQWKKLIWEILPVKSSFPNLLFSPYILDSSVKSTVSNEIVPNKRDNLKILDWYVHAGHQYELCKLGHQFDYVNGVHEKSVWDTKARPQPSNIKFVADFNIQNYDLVICHHSRQVKQMEKFKNIAKIFIFHYQPHEKNDRDTIIRILKGFYIIFNSYQSQRDWNLPKSYNQRVIRVGLDATEWYKNKGGRIHKVLTVGGRMTERNWVTGYSLWQEVTKDLPLRYIGNDKSLGTSQTKSFEELKKAYRDYMVYFNPTTNSPFPRTRIEAMMSGMAIVSTNNHDASEFIQNGVNGFISNDPEELRAYLRILLRYKDLRGELGELARETAIKYFSIGRYLSEWKDLLEEIFK